MNISDLNSAPDYAVLGIQYPGMGLQRIIQHLQGYMNEDIMNTIVSIALFIAGLVLVIYFAEKLVKGLSGHL